MPTLPIEGLKARISQTAEKADTSQSAVLIPWDPFIVNEPVLLLTKRTTIVDTHKGQISFPGGHCETDDETTLHTALREFEEEMGVSRLEIEVLGGLQAVHTLRNTPIHPWIGLVTKPMEYRPNHTEVERIVLLPLRRLLVDGLKKISVLVNGKKISSLGIEVDGELVWGATALILSSLRHELIMSAKGTE